MLKRDLDPVVNPFSSSRVRPGALPWIADPPPRVESLWGSSLNLIVGPHGSGKSTLLAIVAASGAKACSDVRRPRGRWDVDLVRAVIAGPDRRLRIDGWDGLVWIVRIAILIALRATGRQALVTSHRNHRGGRVVHRSDYCPDTAARLVAWLMRGYDADLGALVARASAGLIRQPGHQLYRDLFFDLYDVVQRELRRRDRHRGRTHPSAAVSAS